jgi:hypothetical protein
MIPAAPGAAPQAGEAIRGLRLGGNLDRARGNRRDVGGCGEGVNAPRAITHNFS